MRLPFPERVPLGPVLGFAGALCGVQLFQGTAPLFSLCAFFFIVIMAIAFNVAGGMTRPSGGFIFFFALLVVIVGLFWKAVVGEPADSNLQVPILTMLIYVGAACGMLVAVFISKKLTLKRALMADFVTDDKMQSATIGCTVTGILLTVIFVVVPNKGAGSILSALAQLNQFSVVAILLGTIHTIRRSGGKHCLSFPVILAGASVFVTGVFGFSKQGLITPFVAWAIAAASQRYKLSFRQIAVLGLLTFFISEYLVPYSQYGRTLRAESLSENVSVSIGLLSNLGNVRTQFLNEQAEEDDDLIGGYFTKHQGFLDRLHMIGPDDSLNALTETGIVPGIYPVVLYFENLVPHFIWKDKTNWGGGNLYARQIGIIGDEDETTGISFSPVGEAFHLMRWTGIFVLLPIILIMLFTLFDSFFGDTRKSPWGLIALVSFAHIAPEGGVGIVIYSLGYVTISIVFAAVTSTYLMPIVGEFLIGPNKKENRLLHQS